MNAAEKWGLPDWRDASAYPRPEELSARQWWWEFTRRRPDYRNLWEGAQPIAGTTSRYAPDVDEFRIDFELSVIHDPACTISDWDLMQFRYPRNHGRSPQQHLPKDLDHPLALEALELAEHKGRLAQEKGHYLYNFDLTKPLGPQFERAERHLQAIQDEVHGKQPTRRPRQGNWPDFLRVIDARDAGASFRAIADVLWPGQEKTPQSARDTFKAACELRDNFPI